MAEKKLPSSKRAAKRPSALNKNEVGRGKPENPPAPAMTTVRRRSVVVADQPEPELTLAAAAPGDAALTERRSLAAKIALARYSGITNPDVDIRATLDEVGEKVALADFFNGPVAKWVAQHSANWRWVTLIPSDLAAIVTLRDLGKLCFAHLAPKPTALMGADEEIFAGGLA